MIRGLLLVCFGLTANELVCGEEALPVASVATIPEATQFREIGSFQISKAVLTQLGKTTEMDKGSLILRVFTDGIDIRISPEGNDDDYLAFQIYRNGDINDPAGKNSIPGVQAFSDQGEVVRHLVINSKLLTLTKFPTSTSDVEIIYATRYER